MIGPAVLIARRQALAHDVAGPIRIEAFALQDEPCHHADVDGIDGRDALAFIVDTIASMPSNQESQCLDYRGIGISRQRLTDRLLALAPATGALSTGGTRGFYARGFQIGDARLRFPGHSESLRRTHEKHNSHGLHGLRRGTRATRKERLMACGAACMAAQERGRDAGNKARQRTMNSSHRSFVVSRFKTRPGSSYGAPAPYFIMMQSTLRRAIQPIRLMSAHEYLL